MISWLSQSFPHGELMSRGLRDDVEMGSCHNNIRPSEQPHRPPSSTIARVASAAARTQHCSCRDHERRVVTSASSASFHDTVCRSRVAARPRAARASSGETPQRGRRRARNLARQEIATGLKYKPLSQRTGTTRAQTRPLAPCECKLYNPLVFSLWTRRKELIKKDLSKQMEHFKSTQRTQYCAECTA